MKYFIYCCCIAGISFGLNSCSNISDKSAKTADETITPSQEAGVKPTPLTPDEYHSDESVKTPTETIIPNQEPRVELTPLTPDEYQRAINLCLSFNKTVNECQSQVSSSKFTVIQPSR